jgi:predicted permease
MFDVAYNIITPVFLIIGVAMVVERSLAPDPRPLSKLILYLFNPFLILDSLIYARLQASEAGQLVAMALLTSLLVTLAAWGIARFARIDPGLVGTFVLTSVLINAGNYGIPVNEFACGASGRERAVIYFTATVVISNTLGVFVASRGTVSTRQALWNVIRIPTPYAILIGLLVNVSRVSVPLPLERTIKLLSQASVPCMLVLLGLQLSRASIKGRIQPILMVSSVRLIVSPLIAVGLAALLGVSGVERQVSLVQAGMPTAVITSVLATEFGGDSEFTTGVILISTLASTVTLSVLLSLVM